MPNNTKIWLILEIAFYLLIFYLVVDFISLTFDRCKENSVSTIDEIILIAEVEPSKKSAENSNNSSTIANSKKEIVRPQK